MLPKVSQVLHIQINSIDEEEARQEYKSRIADISEHYITMEVPMNERTGKLKKLYAGDELSVYFMTDGGVKNYFTSSVLGFREDVVRVVLIRKPELEAITKIQRRNFLRVPAELDLAVKLTEQLQFVGVTDDVSGGGISFLCDPSIPLETQKAISCWLLLSYRNGKVDHVPFKGEIVRLKGMDSGKQQVMVRFIDISDKDRQKIIRYCFERQLEIRKT